MEAHQLRVCNEHDELLDKISKLIIFINQSPVFKGLDRVEQARLRAQLFHMRKYDDILMERIEAF